MPEPLILIALFVLWSGAFVQAVIGFGMGVITIPLLVWFGLPLPQAIGLLLPNVLVQTGFNCWQNRSILPWSDVWFVLFLRCVGLPIGVATLRLLSETDPLRTRQVLGFGLIAIMAVQGCANYFGQTSSPRQIWTIPAGLGSGFLAGLIGMGGPLLVMWVLTRGWEPTRQRAFLWLSFLLALPWQAGSLVWGFGHEMTVVLGYGVLAAPIVVTGAWLGDRMGRRLSRQHVRWLMQTFLMLLATRLILAPWIDGRG